MDSSAVKAYRRIKRKRYFLVLLPSIGIMAEDRTFDKLHEPYQYQHVTNVIEAKYGMLESLKDTAQPDLCTHHVL